MSTFILHSAYSLSDNMKKIVFILVAAFTLTLVSCKKECVHCHQIKLYEGEDPGKFQITSIQEVCGTFEQRKFKKLTDSGSDANGDYDIWWECDLYPDDTTATY